MCCPAEACIANAAHVLKGAPVRLLLLLPQARGPCRVDSWVLGSPMCMLPCSDAPLAAVGSPTIDSGRATGPEGTTTNDAFLRYSLSINRMQYFQCLVILASWRHGGTARPRPRQQALRASKNQARIKNGISRMDRHQSVRDSQQLRTHPGEEAPGRQSRCCLQLPHCTLPCCPSPSGQWP